MGRRYGLGFYAVLLVLLAVFVNEPMATLEVTAQMFKAVGEFGGSVVSEQAAGDEVAG